MRNMKNHLVRMTFTVEAALVIEIPDEVSEADEVANFVKDSLESGEGDVWAAIGEGDEWYPMEVWDEGEHRNAFATFDVTLGSD